MSNKNHNVPGGTDEKTTATISLVTAAPVAAAMAAPTPVQPEFIRLPKKGVCPWTGLSRAHLYALIKSGEIRSACLRQRGRTRGVRLVVLSSVLQLIRNHAE